MLGGIAGVAENVTNCSVAGTIVLKGTEVASNILHVGGIVGHGSGTNNCISNVDIKVENNNTTYCGGVVGFPRAVKGRIINCVNKGNISVIAKNNAFVGGICGDEGFIKGCKNYGNISGTDTGTSFSMSYVAGSSVGGIVAATSGDIYYSANEKVF